MLLSTPFPTPVHTDQRVRLALAELPEVIEPLGPRPHPWCGGSGRGFAMPVGCASESWEGTRKLSKTVEIDGDSSRVETPADDGLHRGPSAAVGAHTRQQAHAHTDGVSMNTVEELYKVRSEHFC